MISFGLVKGYNAISRTADPLTCEGVLPRIYKNRGRSLNWFNASTIS